MKRWLFLSCLFFCQLAIGQQILDSLQLQLKNKSVVDNEYIDLKNEIGFQLLLQDPPAALAYINETIEQAETINYEKGLFQATINKGSAFWTSGMLDQSLDYYFRALSMNVEPLGKNHVGIYNNVAEVFKSKGQYDSSIFYFETGLTIVAYAQPRIEHATLLANIGELYVMRELLDSAEFFYSRGLEEGKKYGNRRGTAYCLYGLGEVSRLQLDLVKSMRYHKKALAIRREIQDQRGLMQTHLKIGTLFLSEKKYDSALIYIDLAESLANKYGSLEMLTAAYLEKASLFEISGDLKSANNYLHRYHDLKDSLSNVTFLKNLTKIKATLANEMQAAENKSLREQQIFIQQRNDARLLVIIATFVILILFGLVAYLYRMRAHSIQRRRINQDIIKSLQKASKLDPTHGFNSFINDLLRIGADALQIERVIYWHYNDDEQAVIATNVYSLDKSADHLLGTVATKQKFNRYFKSLFEESILTVNDIRSDTRTAEFDREYLRKEKVYALMDAEIRLEETFVGILSFEKIGAKRLWSNSDRRFASSLTNIIGTAFLTNRNQLLLSQLMENNDRLRNSAYMVSHDLREPLSQIMGFADLAEKDPNIKHREHWNHVKAASLQIDKVIRTLVHQLSKDENAN